MVNAEAIWNPLAKNAARAPKGARGVSHRLGTA